MNGADRRAAQIARLDARREDLLSSVAEEVAALRPLGRPSELSLVMGARPRRGECVWTPIGTFVFAKARRPSATQLRLWEEACSQARAYGEEIARLRAVYVCRPGTTIGNRRPMEGLAALEREGFLGPEEVEYLGRLRAFWAAHPSADSGVVADDGTIEPIWSTPWPPRPPRPAAVDADHARDRHALRGPDALEQHAVDHACGRWAHRHAEEAVR